MYSTGPMKPIEFYEDANLIPVDNPHTRGSGLQSSSHPPNLPELSGEDNSEDASGHCIDVASESKKKSHEIEMVSMERRRSILTIYSCLAVLLILAITFGIFVVFMKDHNGPESSQFDETNVIYDNFPPPPDNLEEICSRPKDVNEFSSCVSACAPAECCLLPSPNNCLQNDYLIEWCQGYITCLPLYSDQQNEEDELVPSPFPDDSELAFFPESLEEMCIDVLNEEEYFDCLKACEAAECCFRSSPNNEGNSVCDSLNDNDVFREWCEGYEKVCIPLLGSDVFLAEMPSPPVEDLEEACSGPLYDRDACKNMCDYRSCCFAVGGYSCYNERNMRLCDEYSQLCSIVSEEYTTINIEVEHWTSAPIATPPQVGADMRPTPPPPPENLENLCQLESDSSGVVPAECWMACAPAECCFASVDSDHNGGDKFGHRCNHFFDFHVKTVDEWCTGYWSGCASLFSDKSSAPVDHITPSTDVANAIVKSISSLADAVNEACNEAKLGTSAAAYESCKALCDTRACCLSQVQNCRDEKDPTWCDEVAGCEVLFNKNGM